MTIDAKTPCSPEDIASALAWVRHRLDFDLSLDDLRSTGTRGQPAPTTAVARALFCRELLDAGYAIPRVAEAVGGGYNSASLVRAAARLPPRCPK